MVFVRADCVGDAVRTAAAAAAAAAAAFSDGGVPLVAVVFIVRADGV